MLGIPAEAHASIGRERFRMMDMSCVSGMVDISNHAFDSVSRLANVVWPRGMRSVGQFSFRGTGLRALELLGTKLAIVSRGAFSLCKSLVTIQFPTQL
jgi:hypothetical protein